MGLNPSPPCFPSFLITPTHQPLSLERHLNAEGSQIYTFISTPLSSWMSVKCLNLTGAKLSSDVPPWHLSLPYTSSPSSQPFHSTKYFTKLQSNLACSLKPLSSHWQMARDPAFTNIWNTCTSCQLASGCTLAQQWLLWGVPHWSMLLTSLTSISVTVIPVEPKAEDDVPVSNPYLTS